jgi:hypothetical protein
MADMGQILKTIGSVIVAVLALGGMIYLQYWRAKWMSDRKDQKADVQTLFSGRK